MGVNLSNDEGTVPGSDWVENLDEHTTLHMWLQGATDGKPVWMSCIVRWSVGIESLIYVALSATHDSALHSAKQWHRMFTDGGNGFDSTNQSSPGSGPPGPTKHPFLFSSN
jgi:hypothetical protein